MREEERGRSNFIVETESAASFLYRRNSQSAFTSVTPSRKDIDGKGREDMYYQLQCSAAAVEAFSPSASPFCKDKDGCELLASAAWSPAN